MKYEDEVRKLLKNATALHLVSGLAAECGEVCGLYQKASYKGKWIDKADMKLELGDVLFYVAALAINMDTTIEELQELNIAKLKERHA